MSATLTVAPPAAATTRRPRILLISLFHPELLRGGAQQICYELFEGLKERGDADVTLLASTDNSYPALFKAGARITGFDGKPDEFLFLMQDYDYWWHKTSSPLVVEAFIDFLEMIQPDVVHFHHFFTYGADFITLTRRTLPEARLIFTFHEFMSICAADGQMVRTFDRSLCTHASPVRCHQCFPDRSPEQFLTRRLWFQSHLAHIDVFTCPSRFMIEHYVRWGIPREKIHHVTNGQRRYGEPATPPEGLEDPLRLLRPVRGQQGRPHPAPRRPPAARRGLHRILRRSQRRQPEIRLRASRARGDRGLPGRRARVAARRADRDAERLLPRGSSCRAVWRAWIGASCRAPGGKSSGW